MKAEFTESKKIESAHDDEIGEHHEYDIDRDLGEDATFFEAMTGKEGATFKGVVSDLLHRRRSKKKPTSTVLKPVYGRG